MPIIGLLLLLSLAAGAIVWLFESRHNREMFGGGILKGLVRTEFPGQVHVLAGTFNHYYMSMGMPTGSPLREPINRALLKIIAGDEWFKLVESYIGRGH
ncbi:MAG: hypothetical protein KJP23_22760 [Deltaproteobacteria bacterium]|nr:hypothetical protein [Deltaproteobacteria bacterium]